MNESAVESKLDHLIALYELVNHETLSDARKDIRSDVLVASILDATEDWAGAGGLKSSIAAKLGTSEKSVQRRIAELVERRALTSRRSDGGIQYRSTGVI